MNDLVTDTVYVEQQEGWMLAQDPPTQATDQLQPRSGAACRMAVRMFLQRHRQRVRLVERHLALQCPE